MVELHSDVADMSDKGNFNFNTTLSDMELYFEATSVHEGSHIHPLRPPTASGPVPNLAPPSQAPAPLPMADLHFDVSDMFDIGGGDFNFNTTLSHMELYFDTTSMHDGSSLDTK